MTCARNIYQNVLKTMTANNNENDTNKHDNLMIHIYQNKMATILFVLKLNFENKMATILFMLTLNFGCRTYMPIVHQNPKMIFDNNDRKFSNGRVVGILILAMERVCRNL